MFIAPSQPLSSRQQNLTPRSSQQQAALQKGCKHQGIGKKVRQNQRKYCIKFLYLNVLLLQALQYKNMKKKKTLQEIEESVFKFTTKPLIPKCKNDVPQSKEPVAPATFCCLLSVYCLLSTVYYLLSTVYCKKSGLVWSSCSLQCQAFMLGLQVGQTNTFIALKNLL